MSHRKDNSLLRTNWEECPYRAFTLEQLCCDEAVALLSCPSYGCLSLIVHPAFALGLEAEVNHRLLTGLGGRAPQQLLPSYPGLPAMEELAAALSPG